MLCLVAYSFNRMFVLLLTFQNIMFNVQIVFVIYMFKCSKLCGCSLNVQLFCFAIVQQQSNIKTFNCLNSQNTNKQLSFFYVIVVFSTIKFVTLSKPQRQTHVLCHANLL